MRSKYIKNLDVKNLSKAFNLKNLEKDCYSCLAEYLISGKLHKSKLNYQDILKITGSLICSNILLARSVSDLWQFWITYLHSFPHSYDRQTIFLISKLLWNYVQTEDLNSFIEFYKQGKDYFKFNYEHGVVDY